MLLQSDFIRRYGLSGNTLKLLALLIMLVDHVGAVLLPQYRILRYIGRLSFPIYCFLITEGVMHTHSIYRYGARLLAFAVISEIPFDLAIFGEVLEFSEQNVFFTLFIGMAVVYLTRIMDISKGFAVLFLGMGLALWLRTDYSAYGIIIIYCFYIFREKPLWMLISVGITNYIMGIGGTGSQKYAVLAMIPVFLYSGRKSFRDKETEEDINIHESEDMNAVMPVSRKKTTGQLVLQYGFYAVYPIHLFLLYLIKKYVM